MQEKIDAWLTRGFIIKYEFGVFLPPSWIAVMLGQNLVPRGHDRRVDAAPAEVLRQNANGIRAATLGAARNSPDHYAFIKQIGAASQSAPLVAASRPSA